LTGVSGLHFTRVIGAFAIMESTVKSNENYVLLPSRGGGPYYVYHNSICRALTKRRTPLACHPGHPGGSGLHFILPQPLRFGPDWLLLVITSALMCDCDCTSGRPALAERCAGHVVLSILTVSMVWSLFLLITRLPAHTDTPQTLLRAAAALWVANVLVFASWYWRLDAGGPNARDRRKDHDKGAFLFPQMIMPDEDVGAGAPDSWITFLAFNTSTAFSPTDVPVLSPWAKLMMIVQASISLTTVALIAARAVNIL